MIFMQAAVRFSCGSFVLFVWKGLIHEALAPSTRAPGGALTEDEDQRIRTILAECEG